jgi:hypothetical protein
VWVAAGDLLWSAKQSRALHVTGQGLEGFVGWTISCCLSSASGKIEAHRRQDSSGSRNAGLRSKIWVGPNKVSFVRIVGIIYDLAPRLWHRILSSFPWLKRVALAALQTFPDLDKDGKIVFAGLEMESYSQARQDVFVQVFSMFHPFQTYVEIGAAKPIESNNTFVLERKGWSGISIEISNQHAQQWDEQRSNPLLIANALELDYRKLFEEHRFERDIGYLQVDIEPAENSLAALKMIPWDSYRFATITFEHDKYQNTSGVREAARDYLFSKGYVMVVRDIKWAPGKEFEDWFVHPDLVRDCPIGLAPDNGWFSKATEARISLALVRGDANAGG